MKKIQLISMNFTKSAISHSFLAQKTRSRARFEGHAYANRYPYPYPLVPIPATCAGMPNPCIFLWATGTGWKTSSMGHGPRHRGLNTWPTEGITQGHDHIWALVKNPTLIQVDSLIGDICTNQAGQLHT